MRVRAQEFTTTTAPRPVAAVTAQEKKGTKIMATKKTEMAFTCNRGRGYGKGAIRVKVLDGGLNILVSDGEPWGDCGCETINLKQVKSLKKFLAENYPDV